MKITVSQETLKAALGRINNVVCSASSATPILGHFLLMAKEGKVTIRATDQRIATRGPLEATIAEEGLICPPARKLLEIVKELEEGDVVLESKDPAWLNVSFGKSKFKLACLKPEDFPSWPAMKKEQSFALKAGEIADMLEKTVYCTGEGDAKYTLNGVLFHIQPAEKTLTVAATDGHRMSVVTKDVLAGGEEKKLIVPKKAATEFKKFIVDPEAIVTVAYTANHLFVKIGEIDFMALLIEGTYPAYNQVIPQNNPKKVAVVSSALVSSLRKTMILSREGNKSVKLDVAPGTIALSSGSAELGEANDSLPVEYDGDPLTIAFNPVLLLEAVQAFEKTGVEKVTLSFDQPLTPALVSNNGGKDHLCVVMPIRL